MNHNKSAIIFDNISKNYGHFQALKKMSLTVNNKELFGFLGPNGAGKTTLIRILTGIIKPTTGNVIICEHDLYKAPDKARSSIGFVPDRPYLYEKLTPIEYLDFMAGLYNVKSSTAFKKGEEMLKMFSLWDRRNELIESFSHGMKQKVAMSASIIHDPEIFVVDEPTVGLDPASVKIVKDFFIDFVKSGKTIFLTTHTLSVAQDLCDRIAILREGEIVALGTLKELQEQAKLPGNNLEEVFLKITQEQPI